MHAGSQIGRTRPHAAPGSGQCGVGCEKHLQLPFRAATCAEWRCQTCPAAAPNGLFRRAIRPVLQCQTAACRSRLCASHLRRGPRRRCLAAQIVTKTRRPAGPSMAGAEHSRPRPRGTPRRAIGRQRRQGSARGPPTGENEGVKIVRNCRFATCLHENAPCQHDFPPHRPPFFVILPWSKTENKLLDYINILLNYFVLTSETVYYGYCIGSARAVGVCG